MYIYIYIHFPEAIQYNFLLKSYTHFIKYFSHPLPTNNFTKHTNRIISNSRLIHHKQDFSITTKKISYSLIDP